MCGIAGHFGVTAIDTARIRCCLDRMRRRGPDHEASCRLGADRPRAATFVHTRLNIIDPDERANQPMRVGSKVLIYNGELYNYLELRKELLARGETFRTESDTEVLLRTIHSLGWVALDRCEGMWALAVYDEADGSLTLSRDRFGEKPLYLYRDDHGLYFGSEAKFVSALLGRRLPVNLDQVYRYLVNGYKALYKEPQTFFRGLSELAPGTALRIEADGSETSWRYWEPRVCLDETLSYEEAVAGVRERVIHAVELRLRADVPLAFCMSGGVDSNALISVAKRQFDYDVHGFTIMNSDARYDEKDLVDEAVRALGIRHTAIPVDTRDFLPRLRRLVRYHDAPVYTITYFAHSLLMEAIAGNGYRISLSGTAADELFSGYFDHHLAYLYEVRGQPEIHRAALLDWTQKVRPIVRNPHLSDPDLFVRNPDFRDHVFLNADDFAATLRRPWSEPFQEKRFTPHLLRNRMLNELFHEAVPVILHEDDLNAMYYSIENRSPYLDRALFDFCYTVPTRHLIRNGFAKALLRESMRGIVPDAILDNPRKVGFNIPILSFLDVTSGEIRQQLLDDSPIFEHVHRDSIEGLLRKATLPNSESKFLFYFLSAKMFLEEFAA